MEPVDFSLCFVKPCTKSNFCPGQTKCLPYFEILKNNSMSFCHCGAEQSTFGRCIISYLTADGEDRNSGPIDIPHGAQDRRLALRGMRLAQSFGGHSPCCALDSYRRSKRLGVYKVFSLMGGQPLFREKSGKSRPILRHSLDLRSQQSTRDSSWALDTMS